jgi:protoporphyrin/coproporphyrin ferrochelatase
MSTFRDEPGYAHGQQSGIGVLFANLGTPDAPTASALRRYLREFLWDPRVIELPRWKWWPILELFVLTTRPKASAKLYEKVWTPQGSPLLGGTRDLARGLEAGLRAAVAEPIHVAVGMRYGQPSLAGALAELADRGCRKVLVFPLYPQYSGTTTASTFDAVFAELSRWRWVPELRTVASYHDDPGYVGALAASIRDSWATQGRSQRLLLTFHGIPRRYFEAGDPYYCHCQKTARLVAEHLGLGRDDYLVTFQSLFGKEEWLKPYTDETVRRLGSEKLASLDIACPGFGVDCLETLEEIDGLNREIFEHAGGGHFRYVPCLNQRPDHVAALTGIALRHLSGWVTPAGLGAAAAEPPTRELALAQAAQYPGGITAR